MSNLNLFMEKRNYLRVKFDLINKLIISSFPGIIDFEEKDDWLPLDDGTFINLKDDKDIKETKDINVLNQKKETLTFNSHLIETISPDVELYFSSLCKEEKIEKKEDRVLTRYLQNVLGSMLSGQSKFILKLDSDNSIMNSLSCILTEVFGNFSSVIPIYDFNLEPNYKTCPNYIKKKLKIIPLLRETNEDEWKQLKIIINLGHKLQRDHKNDVLTWLYEGCKNTYLVKGELSEPKIVEELTKNLFKTTFDYFIEEQCILDKDSSSSKTDFYFRYKKYSRDCGKQPMPLIELREELKRKGVVYEKNMFVGIKLVDESYDFLN
jgi:hypothetical protein